MTPFWVVAACFVAGALLMLLPPLLAPRSPSLAAGSANLALHRDQLREAQTDLAAGLLTPERFAELRAEIERRVIEDVRAGDGVAATRPARGVALVVALALPLGAVLLYLQLGRPAATAPATMPAERHSLTPEQVGQRASALAERLGREPDNAEGWLMLGRSYALLGRYRDGAVALRRASELLPKNANVLVDLADVVGMAQGKRLAGEPARLVQQALDLDPRHLKALALAGSVAFESKDYAAARAYWQRALALLPADAPLARSMQANLTEASQLEGAPAVAVATLAGEVALSPALAARVAAGDTLFVFARAAEGPRMPLAVVRRPVGAWPAAFTLDDSQAMSPALRLSRFTQVVVGARVSESGNATPQSGDLVGHSAAVAPGAQGLRIVIDSVQP